MITQNNCINKYSILLVPTKGFLIRFLRWTHSHVRKISFYKIDRYDVTDYRGESDVILGFYLFISRYDIFRTLECIESKQPCLLTYLNCKVYKLIKKLLRIETRE